MARVVAIHTGKGGAKKTSIATNISAITAAAKYKVLLIDLDRQGNCGEDLGYTDLADDGLGLRQSLEEGTPLTPTLVARERLEVVAGGPELKGLRLRRGQNPFNMLVECLAPVADDYDLVVIDTPPGGSNVIDMALGASRYLIIPSPPDRSSIKGLEFVAESVEEARRHNPQLTLLGVILVEIPTSATRIRADAMDGLEKSLGNPGLLFRTSVRSALKTAETGRRLGQLPHELATAQDGGRPFWEFLRSGQRVPDHAQSAPGLAGDYVAITDEVLVRIDHEETRADLSNDDRREQRPEHQIEQEER